MNVFRSTTCIVDLKNMTKILDRGAENICSLKYIESLCFVGLQASVYNESIALNFSNLTATLYLCPQAFHEHVLSVFS